MDKKDDSIGALWSKQGAKGNYLSGYVEVGGQKVNIVCFVNAHKREEKHPDYRILVSKPQTPARGGFEGAEVQLNDTSLDIPL